MARRAGRAAVDRRVRKRRRIGPRPASPRNSCSALDGAGLKPTARAVRRIDDERRVLRRRPHDRRPRVAVCEYTSDRVTRRRPRLHERALRCRPRRVEPSRGRDDGRRRDGAAVDHVRNASGPVTTHWIADPDHGTARREPPRTRCTHRRMGEPRRRRSYRRTRRSTHRFLFQQLRDRAHGLRDAARELHPLKGCRRRAELLHDGSRGDLRDPRRQQRRRRRDLTFQFQFSRRSMAASRADRTRRKRNIAILFSAVAMLATPRRGATFRRAPETQGEPDAGALHRHGHADHRPRRQRDDRKPLTTSARHDRLVDRDLRAVRRLVHRVFDMPGCAGGVAPGTHARMFVGQRRGDSRSTSGRVRHASTAGPNAGHHRRDRPAAEPQRRREQERLTIALGAARVASSSPARR